MNHNTPKSFRNLAGKRFGRLHITGRVARPGNIASNGVYWEAFCSCGKRRVVRTDALTTKRTQSCGCYQAQRAGEAGRATRVLSDADRAAWKKAYGRRYKMKNRERLRAYSAKQRLKPEHRILYSLRNRINDTISRGSKSATTRNLLGCPIESFMLYLESKFESGMSWKNYGRGEGKWHLDHIMPCAIFDLSKPEHQKRCFHFSNLQPLWGIENDRKGVRITQPQFKLSL